MKNGVVISEELYILVAVLSLCVHKIRTRYIHLADAMSEPYRINTLPSKRKIKLAEDLLENDGWFSVCPAMWRGPGETPKKLRLVADANFPDGLVRLIKREKVDIRTARALGMERLSDENLLPKVSQAGCALITLDRDFWSDEKVPLHRQQGVVFVDGKDESIGRTLGFAFMLIFLKTFHGWKGAKFRVTSTRLFFKAISFENKKVVYELQLIASGVYAREIAG